MAAGMAELTEGTRAPAFKLPGGAGEIALEAHRGRKAVVYFYPKDDTSGCTREALEFTERVADFAAADTTIIGISPDSLSSHERFAAKHGLAVLLGSDADRKVVEAYGVWAEKSMYGRKYMGVERTTFLIARDGRIARIWRKVKAPGHAAEVLAAARSLE
jgi:peroxiredoxin Q/BCP